MEVEECLFHVLYCFRLSQIIGGRFPNFYKISTGNLDFLQNLALQSFFIFCNSLTKFCIVGFHRKLFVLKF